MNNKKYSFGRAIAILVIIFSGIPGMASTRVEARETFVRTAPFGTISVRRPDSVNVGIKNIPAGWGDDLTARNVPFTGSSVLTAGRLIGCEYGDFTLTRPFPPGHICKVSPQPKFIECTQVKPPIKIPGKKEQE